MKKLFSQLFKNRGLKRARELVTEINALEETFQGLSAGELKEHSEELKERAQGTSLDAVLPEAFALVRETAQQTLRQRHYDEQLMAGIVLHEGRIAEMLTGEGKTLASTLPVYLNALNGKGVHVVTVNEYLARRDTVWMGQIYHALGLSVTCLVHEGAYIYDPEYTEKERAEDLDRERDEKGSFKVVSSFLRPITRKEAYRADITYGTNHEFGFDYLRDNLVLNLGDRVQRGFPYVIIDEVDNVLIDEARTPLIISAPDQQSSDYYKLFAGAVRKLQNETDYAVDEKRRSVSLTDAGIGKVEQMVQVENIFAPEHARLVHYLNESLKAKELFHRDKEYVIRDNEVIIVDQFTGRMLQGRRYSGGLHQAIEAKEGVPVQQENRTYAQVTIQNYFRFYEKLSGMTGTAQSSAEEFHKVYDLEVVSIPPHRPVARKDLSDLIYKTREAKYEAVVQDVRERHEQGQPVLLGTTSITHNEVLSEYLRKAGIPHEVLNAKNNEREAEIIAQAGRRGSVTVATNMAGRGVDIVLGGNPPEKAESEAVKELGGLHVVGTERHEARRIDDQLRGRSGRQGDPGSSRFYLSLEDDLLRIFGGERIAGLMQSLHVPDDMPIESGIVSKAVNQAQQRVEGMNLDARQHLLDFDDVLERQRNSVYRRRMEFLKAGENNTILSVVAELLNDYITESTSFLQEQIRMLRESGASKSEITQHEQIIDELRGGLQRLPSEIDKDKAVLVSRHMTRLLDTLWVNHLDALQALRESVGIRAYAQHEPIVEYRREAHTMFKQFNRGLQDMLFKTIFTLLEADTPAKEAEPVIAAPSNTATDDKKIGRNDPCWCGSGKKYKKCHGK